MDKRRLDHRQAARLGDDRVEAVVTLQRDIGGRFSDQLMRSLGARTRALPTSTGSPF